MYNLKNNSKKRSIYSLTLAAGESLFEDTLDQKFFFNSLIHSKNIFLKDYNFQKNYFLISNEHIYKEKKYKDLIYDSKLKEYGSLGSLVSFLLKLTRLPDVLIVNYIDKEISNLDFENLLSLDNSMNSISVSLPTYPEKLENFYLNGQSYVFNGFLKLNKETLKKIKNIDRKFYNNNLTYLFNSGIVSKNSFNVVYSKSSVNEIRREKEIAKILLGSKSKSLSNLGLLKSAKVPLFFTITKDDIHGLEDKLQKLNKHIIIRSDSDEEDSFTESNAGVFLSIGPLDKSNIKEVKQGINQVFKSYSNKKTSNKVILQNYVNNIVSSGVITTRLLQNSGPYNLISISNSSNSDEVTGGYTNKLLNFYVYKNVKKISGKYKKYQKILNLINELKELINYEYLDIEFAEDKSQNLFLLQVRPLVASLDKKHNSGFLVNNIRKFQHYQNIEHNVYGNYTIFSNMSDWNPAEMLGENPNYLSISLYKTFITNNSWHIQRRQFGYRGQIQTPLMKNFENKCYIDIRASLNSFLTKNLNDDECSDIVNYQLKKLEDNPELHDKIEFNIAATSFDYDLQNKLEKEYKDIISKDAISRWVGDLYEISKNYKKILTLNNRRIQNYYVSLDGKSNYLKKREINKIINNMSIPFAHHARLGFVFFSQLNNFVTKEVITSEEKQLLLSNLNSISNQFTRDLLKVKNNSLSHKKFLTKYGHMRPNNYDINSENLKSKGKDFLDLLLDNVKKEDIKKDNLTGIIKKVDNYLVSVDSMVNGKEWIGLFYDSISSRENSKFMYSKSVDLILNQLKESNIFDTSRLMNLDFERYIDSGVEEYFENNNQIELPDVITNSDNFLYFENLNSRPNYIGNIKVFGDIVEASQDNIKNLKNKIVILPNADPGWDWIFSLEIKGIITKYGGPNSHMAIRAAEKNITSIFGVGDMRYNIIKTSRTIEINPQIKKYHLNL